MASGSLPGPARAARQRGGPAPGRTAEPLGSSSGSSVPRAAPPAPGALCRPRRRHWRLQPWNCGVLPLPTPSRGRGAGPRARGLSGAEGPGADPALPGLLPLCGRGSSGLSQGCWAL